MRTGYVIDLKVYSKKVMNSYFFPEFKNRSNFCSCLFFGFFCSFFFMWLKEYYISSNLSDVSIYYAVKSFTIRFRRERTNPTEKEDYNID